MIRVIVLTLAFLWSLSLNAYSQDEKRATSIDQSMHRIGLMRHDVVQPITKIGFSPDSKMLFSICPADGVVVWSIPQSTTLSVLDKRLKSPHDIAFSKNNLIAISYKDDEKIRFFNLYSFKEITTHEISRLQHFSNAEMYAYKISFIDEENTLFLAGEGVNLASDGELQIWRFDQGTSKRLWAGHGSILSVAVAPKRDFLAIAGFGPEIKFWEIQKDSFSPAKAIWPTKIVNEGTVREVRFPRMIDILTYTNDSLYLATASSDSKEIRVWDVSKNCWIMELRDISSPTLCLAFSPDGKYLASGHGNGSVALWSMTSGRRVTTLSGFMNGCHSLMFSPNGKYFAIGSGGGTIDLFSY